MTKIAVCGDWHANLGFANQVLDHLAEKKVDTIFHVGDFGFLYHPNFVDNLTNKLESYGMHLYFCRGNHDDPLAYGYYDVHGFVRTSPINMTDRIIYMPDYSIYSLRDTEIMFLGGGFSIDKDYRIPGRDWWPEEVTTDPKMRVSIPNADIVISHDAPLSLDIPLRKIPEHLEKESNENRERVERAVERSGARYVACGHYHTRHRGQATSIGATVDVLGHDGLSVRENYIIIQLPE